MLLYLLAVLPIVTFAQCPEAGSCNGPCSDLASKIACNPPEFAASLQGQDHQNQSRNITHGSAIHKRAASTYAFTGTPATIPTLGTVSTYLTIPSGSATAIEDIEVFVDLTHTWVSDLVWGCFVVFPVILR